MRQGWGLTLLVGASAALVLGPPPVFAQACQDEASMVDGSKQAVMEFTDMVKKESLAVFETTNHQKSAVNKLSLHENMVEDLVSCLDKAAQDTTATKEDAAAAKTQHDAAVKLQEKIKLQQAAIKDVKDPKTAKGLIEKIDLTP